MARSARLGRGLVVFFAASIAVPASGCSDLPSKSDALALVKESVKEDAICTLPIATLSRFKMQHTTKSICVPREGGGAMDQAWACLETLAASGATSRMPRPYMAEWPDELLGASFDAVSPYERRSRDQLFKGCVEMAPGLREGQFRCGDARAEKVVRIVKQEGGRALVRYARDVELDPKLGAIDAACGAVTRPAPEGSLTIEMSPDKRWQAASSETSPSASASSR